MIRLLKTYRPTVRRHIWQCQRQAADLYNDGLALDDIAEAIGHSSDFTRALLIRAVGYGQARTQSRSSVYG